MLIAGSPARSSLAQGYIQGKNPMQVIGAGFGRTGTMSMQAALEILGFRCYHMKEVTEHAGHLQAWQQFVAGRAPMDWQTLFKDFKATVDFPACIYYRELLREFPHAKVVLSIRDPDRWFGSFLTLQQTTDRFRVFRFIPRARRFLDFVDLLLPKVFTDPRDRARCIEVFERHNREVQEYVPADGPVTPLTLLQPPGATLAARRSGNDLPSRVADNLCWLGRHVERAESTARLLRSIFTRMLSESTPGSMSELGVLFRALTGQPPPAESAAGDRGAAAMELALLGFLYDPQTAGSLRMVLAALARVATVVRDRISLDTWRILQRIDDDFHLGYPLGVVSPADVLATLNQMILNFSAFGGVAMENMTRGPGWQFLDLGRRIERALNMIALLRTSLFIAAENEHAVLEALLEIVDSSMTYRNRYATNLQLPTVIDLLMTDESNPRSIAYQLVRLADHVERLPRQAADSLMSSEQRAVLTILSAIRLADVNLLAETDELGIRRQFDELLNHAATELVQLANGISQKYLVHTGPARQLAGIPRG